MKRLLWYALYGTLLFDSLLVGWLLFAADTVVEFLIGAAVSVAIPVGLFGAIYLLERRNDRRTDSGRHAR